MPWNTNGIKNDWADTCHFTILSYHSRSDKVDKFFDTFNSSQSVQACKVKAISSTFDNCAIYLRIVSKCKLNYKDQYALSTLFYV